jgi:hypothetical protein
MILALGDNAYDTGLDEEFQVRWRGSAPAPTPVEYLCESCGRWGGPPPHIVQQEVLQCPMN